MKELFKDLNINLTIEQEEAFKAYYNYLLEENKKYNLTRITDYEEVLIKHFYDSLTLLKTGLFKSGMSVADIGSGAGFPGIPLAIINKDINFSLIESQTKKANFLKSVLKLLKLDNVKVYNMRSEEFAKKHFESFEIVTARAVAQLNILSELTLPLVKVGGTFLAMKGDNYESEIEEAKNGIMILGGKLKNILNIELPLQLGKRTIIIIDKKKNVKGYPRPFNQIKKNPL